MVDVAAPDHGVMSNLAWTTPAALWLLLAMPLVWIAHLAARTNFNRRQRRLQAALRSLLLGVIAIALARPVTTSRSSRESIVYAVDVSHSISSHAIEEAARRIDAIDAAVHPAHSRIIAFGGAARAVENTAVLRKLSQADPAAPAEEPRIDRGGTDLEAALDAARSELASEHIPRVILFSDGQATSGDVTSATARLAAAHIPVFVDPMAVRAIGDSWIDRIDVPSRLTAGASVPVSVAIGSQRDTDAIVEIRSGGKVLATRSTHLAKGVSIVALDTAITPAGPATLEASIAVNGDPLHENDSLARPVFIEPRTRVLYVEGAPASARYLSAALTASGFDVAVQTAAAMPASDAAFDAYDVVVLSDVSRAAIPEASMAALAGWVERGGGLLVAGGDAVFGEGTGGYRRTTLERLTPVTFERRDEPSVALILVLDRSWSMAGPSMDLSKAAAAAALDVMAPEQSLGVLTFNDKFDWDVTLRSVGKNRDAIRKKIAAIEPSGRTLIYPALEQAYFALRSAKARAKHVVLLSDGRSYPDDYQGLVKKMTDAQITVSSIAVGPSADQELLRNVARWGGGREYDVADAHDLPEIFVKEAKDAAAPAFQEKRIQAVVKRPAFLQDVDVAHIPPLRGVTATVMKDSAIEVAATSDDDPLLAFWPVGLGRTAVFASDVKDRWAAEWVRWRGYGPFFSAVVRALERQRDAAIALEVAPGPAHGSTRAVRMSIEARDARAGYRDLLRPVFVVASGAGRTREVAARQVAPGRYEAAVVVDARQPVTITALEKSGASAAAAPSRTIAADAASEYRFRPPDEDLLNAIAAATGGSWRPAPAALGVKPGESASGRRPLWPALVMIALGLWFVDLLFRRLRVLE
jgi:Ca-activated chloride channel family protein